MKARARISTLLILMISLAGFGNTTPDLIQNSDAVTISNYDVGVDIVMVLNVEAVNSDLTFKVRPVEIPSSYLKELSQESQMLLATNRFKQLFEDADEAFNKTYKDVFIYRRARDGINCNFSRVQT